LKDDPESSLVLSDSRISDTLRTKEEDVVDGNEGSRTVLKAEFSNRTKRPKPPLAPPNDEL